MKKIALIIGLALVAGFNSLNAQTNLWGDLGNIAGDLGLSSNPTNYAVATFVGASETGGKLSAGLIVVENVNNYIGAVAGIDHLWFGGKTDSANIINGGITLQAPMYPVRTVFKWVGLSLGTNTWAYNERVTPFNLALVGTPVNGTSNDGGLCGINRTGINFDLVNVKGFEFGASIDHGTRTGAGNYDGNWWDVSLNLRKSF